MALTDGLASFWTLDEASGSRLDSVGGQTLTDNGGVGSTAGMFSNGATFDGSNDYLSAADSSVLSTGDIDYMVAAWVYITTHGTGNKRIMCKSTNTASAIEYQLFYSSTEDRLKWEVFNGGSSAGNLTSSGALSLNTWHLVIAWHAAGTGGIGLQIDNGTPDGSSGSATDDTTAPFAIGSLSGLATTFLTGTIDEVAFWKRLLDSTERTALWNSGAGVQLFPGGGGGGTAVRNVLQAHGPFI